MQSPLTDGNILTSGNFSLETSYAPPPIDKNLTYILIETEDGHKGFGVAILPEGPLPLAEGTINCTGQLELSQSTLTWANFADNAFPGGLSIGNGTLQVGVFIKGGDYELLAAICTIPDTELQFSTYVAITYETISNTTTSDVTDKEDL